MINTESYTTPDNIPRPIQLETENIIAIYELGVINVGDNTVTCHGQTKRVDDNMIEDVLQIAQFKIITQRERYKAKDSRLQTAFHAKSAHTVVPHQQERTFGNIHKGVAN